MFEGLVKSRFFNKCKSKTRLTITRLEMIKKKRNAMQKFLKNDIVDLLKNGLDNNAYGRAEGFLLELNFTSCYEFVEEFCVRILDNISVMNKQRECPENCLEAVSSLIFAAARFADLPELRDLRSIFTERYGTSLDSYVNKEFVDKLQLLHPTKVMKLQLMQDIAQESGVQWNCKVAEEKLFNHLPRAFENVKNSVTDDVFQAHRNVDDSRKVRYKEHSWSSPRSRKQHQERAPFWSLPRKRKTEVVKENVDDKENSEQNLIPPPPYRRSYVDHNQTDGEERIVDRLLMRYGQTKSSREIRETESDQKSVLMRNVSWNVSWNVGTSEAESPSVEQESTKKGHHIRSASAQTESKKLPDYDDLVARFAALRQKC